MWTDFQNSFTIIIVLQSLKPMVRGTLGLGRQRCSGY